MNVELITIGDELLIGQVINTNAAFMAKHLNAAGMVVVRETTVRDHADDIKNALTEAFSRVDIVLMTGGLGPTKDDITKPTLCEYFNTELVPNLSVKAHIVELYKNRPNVLNRLTETQWLVPQSATIIENTIGSAPIMWFEQNGKVLVSMPGVPMEMEAAMGKVIPLLQAKFEMGAVHHKTLIVHGVPESELALKLEKFEQNLPADVHLAYLPKPGFVRLRLSAYKENIDLNELFSSMKSALYNVGMVLEKDMPIEQRVGEWLKARHKTICTAESCTGGRIAARLAKWPGSSEFFMGGVVAYDNSIKQAVLGVKEKTLKKHGAVSMETVMEMAQGAKSLMKTDYAIAISGIAGPTGGTPDKPVGTVWIAVATDHNTCAGMERMSASTHASTRERNIEQAVEEALFHFLFDMRTAEQPNVFLYDEDDPYMSWMDED